MDFRTALALEGRLHPLLGPADYLKLAYQAAFGAEHLMRDRDEAKRFFDEEWGKVPSLPGPIFQEIGGGFARASLAAWKYQGLPPNDLFVLFAASAQKLPPRSSAHFEDHLRLITNASRGGRIPLSLEDWDRLLAVYRHDGGGPVRHSDVYRRAYEPHYRLIRLTPLPSR